MGGGVLARSQGKLKALAGKIIFRKT